MKGVIVEINNSGTGYSSIWRSCMYVYDACVLYVRVRLYVWYCVIYVIEKTKNAPKAIKEHYKCSCTISLTCVICIAM